MKKKYIVPEMEITEFDTEDVITASIGDGGNAGDFPSGENGEINIP